MCGLCGVYSGSGLLVDREKEPAKLLLFLSMLRGLDSTGVMVGWKKNGADRISYQKRTETALDFMSLKKVDDLFKLPNTFMIAAHTRAATSGDVNEQNAQPMQEGNIIGMHNGTIEAFKGEALKEKVSDSRILMRHINDYGIQDTVKQIGTPTQYGGAYAITYVDLLNGTFNIARNKERTFYIMYTEDEDTFYWASERCMLEFVANRLDMKVKEPYPLMADKLFSFKLGGDGCKEIDIPPPRLELKPRVGHWGQGRPLFNAGPNDPPWSSGSGALTGTDSLLDDIARRIDAKLEEKQDEDTLERQALALRHKRKTWASGELTRFYDHRRDKFYSLYKGFGNKIYPALEIEKKLRNGCTLCTANMLTVTSPVWWINKHHFICQECYTDPSVTECVDKGHQLYLGQLCGEEAN